MKVIVAGGSGFIGRALVGTLLSSHHEVTVLSRTPESAGKYFPGARVLFWDAKTDDALIDIVHGADAIITLVGESIAANRWTQARKQRILSSRADSTRALVRALHQTNRKPSVLLNASAVGYYGHVPEQEVTESSPRGEGFLAEVCASAETEAMKAKEFGIRVVVLRTGIVLDKNGGVLRKLLFPFQLFLGGPMGSGRQWFPWIHLQDEVRAILFAMANERIDGPVNLTAPDCVRLSEFCDALGTALHRPSWLHVPAVLLKLALGEMAEPLLLHGQKVIPRKLLETGFKFQFPVLNDALQNLFV